MTDFSPTDFEATRAEPGFVGWSDNGPIFRVAPEFDALASAGNPWWPRADNRVQRANTDGGSIIDGYPEKSLFHTTETDGWPGYSTGSFPHLTVRVEVGRFVARQHIPFNRAGRALRNESGGVQTNRLVRCQVEIITRADIVDERGLDPAMSDGLAELAEWLEAEWGVPRVCTVEFKSYPSSYGKGNGVRLSGAEWERYAGWLGHQHAAENDHGDPGALDWRPILQPADLQEADMPLNDADKQWIESRLDASRAELTKRVEDLYRLAARGELNGTIDPASTHYADSVRGTREAILDALAEPPPA